MEQAMMDSVLSCATGGWIMLAGSILTYGTLALAGAALIKHLFFAGHTQATA
jgi:hypothetical protein